MQAGDDARIEASLVVAGLVNRGSVGDWAATLLDSGNLAAPHLLPAEAADILRRATLAGEISADVAALAHADLLGLRVALFPYEPVAARIWELRGNVTAYDGWYVAVAESVSAPLATLDHCLARAPGPRCEFLLQPGAAS